MAKTILPPAVRAALRRLAASDTACKRLRARAAFRAAIKKWTADVQAQYPTLDAEGKPILKKKPRGCVCPFCQSPMKSFYTLTRHLIAYHGKNHRHCVCGFSIPFTESIPACHRRIARHLGAQPDLAAHFAYAGLKAAVQGDRV